jgi:acetyltransferase-like isoleucine patch superfamily enzyme
MSIVRTIVRNLLGHKEDNISRWRRLGARIGQGVFIGFDCAIDEGFAPLLTIEDGAVISARTLIMLHDSAMNNVCGAPIKVGRVIVGSNSYVGVNSTILCGVRIGEKAIVGAGSVVTRDIPDETVAFGCPAVVRGTLREFHHDFLAAAANSSRYKYWDIMPWRNRLEHMSRGEIETSLAVFMAQFSGE